MLKDDSTRHTRVAAPVLEARRCRSHQWRRSVQLEEQSDDRVIREEQMDWTSFRDATGIRSGRCGACGVMQNQGRPGTLKQLLPELKNFCKLAHLYNKL
jgi:hypothetical protein